MEFLLLQSVSDFHIFSNSQKFNKFAQLIDYWDAYYDYHSRCYKWVSNVRTEFIDGFRERLNKNREEFKKSRASRSDNSFHSAANSKVIFLIFYFLKCVR